MRDNNSLGFDSIDRCGWNGSDGFRPFLIDGIQLGFVIAGDWLSDWNSWFDDFTGHSRRNWNSWLDDFTGDRSDGVSGAG